MSQIKEYSPTEAALADLEHRFKNVAFDLTTTKGDKEARAARLELVKLGSALEAERKRLKAPALERSRLIDAEAKRIDARITALKDPIDAQIKADEARREAERQAREAEEARQLAERRERERLLHGREMLEAFVEGYADDAEFALIIPAIRGFLQPAMKEAA